MTSAQEKSAVGLHKSLRELLSQSLRPPSILPTSNQPAFQVPELSNWEQRNKLVHSGTEPLEP